MTTSQPTRLHWRQKTPGIWSAQHGAWRFWIEKRGEKQWSAGARRGSRSRTNGFITRGDAAAWCFDCGYLGKARHTFAKEVE